MSSKTDRWMDRWIIMCSKVDDRELDGLTIEPAGMPDLTSASPTLASSANLSPVMKSTGRWILTLFFFALSIRLCTIFAPSSSYRDEPICKEIRTGVMFSF